MAINPALAKKIANAKASKKGIELRDGEYILTLRRLLCDSMHNGTMLIPEFLVDDSLASDIKDPNTNLLTTPNAKGTECSCAWALDKGGDAGSAALSNAKGFACALLSIPLNDDSEVFAKIGQYSGPDGDPDSLRARGTQVACRTKWSFIKSGKNAGKWGCFPQFTAIGVNEGNSPEEIAKRCAELDALGK